LRSNLIELKTNQTEYVILSGAKDLTNNRRRFFASLRMTRAPPPGDAITNVQDNRPT
jgi:hypothetical protein